MLLLDRIDRQIAGARVFADEHAGIDRIVGAHEQDAAFFESLQRVGGGGTAIHGNERAGHAVGDFTGMFAVFLEQVAHDAVAGGEVHQFRFKADEPAGRDDGLDEGAAGWLGVHVLHHALAVGQRLENALGVIAGCLDVEGLVGF